MSASTAQLRDLRSRLNQLRMPELRNILMDLNLARSGRKSELVERIAIELESFADKACGNTSTGFYTERFAAGMRSIDQQLRGRPTLLPTPQVVSGSFCPAPQISVGIGPIPPTTPTTCSIPAQIYGHRHVSRAQLPFGALSTTPQGSSVIPLPNGVDMYNPTQAAALNGARCFCATHGVSGKVVKCVDCGLMVHAKCHQLITLSSDWYCEMCRSKTYDPFYQVQKTVLDPNFVRFAKAASTFRLEYYITDNDLNTMYAKRDPKPGSMSPGSLELQLRCFAVKEDLATGHCWPASTQLNVNGFGVPITQRAPPGHANPSKVLREIPANIFQYSRVGRNVIDIRTVENPSVFGIMVQIVEVRDINDLVNEVKEASKNVTYESAKEVVIKSFGSEDEDDVVATVTMLSVRCPLGLCVIDLPARGIHCKHLQCFDLKTFILFCKKARSKAWRCTVCHQFIKASDLRIDPYLKKLLIEVQGEEDLEEVEIFPDGSWKRRLEEDLVAEPSAKKVKAEQPELAIASASVSTSTLSAPTIDAQGSSATVPVEIDLLTSDDDDEETTKNASIAVPSTVFASTPLGDDMDILTVSSDAWDMPSASAPISTITDTTSDGNCGEYFPFPLDENLFPSNGFTTNTSSSSSWMHSIPPNSAVSSLSLPASTVTPASMAVQPSRDLLSQAESNLANSMASFSRNHNVDNPFDQRQRRQARSFQKPTTMPNDMDIISLLESDSE
ncbi:sumo ligase [Plasmopara halstedii]|uniref:Sumo ligase n=1 Tax=Plasmopara halstedii TaxID=4781 RepID=A0A0P1A536_PLAHL|nr:sumo ligase [Plasmopara halstedii]CEG35093.1 sumo ligase [Plasmopara halstedii]|eukprot:XP_024571462.1 sumo ligase [Plasmopara halstedii]